MVTRSNIRRVSLLAFVVLVVCGFLVVAQASAATSGGENEKLSSSLLSSSSSKSSSAEEVPSTCSAPEIIDNIPMEEPGEVQAELESLEGSEVPEEYIESVLHFDSKSGAVVALEDGTTMRMIFGYNDEEATSIVRHFDAAGGLISVRALESKNKDGHVDVVDEFNSPELEAGRCARWNKACLDRVKGDYCASSACAWAFWNPVVAAGCLITSCGTKYYNCCAEWRSPDSNMHD